MAEKEKPAETPTPAEGATEPEAVPSDETEVVSKAEVTRWRDLERKVQSGEAYESRRLAKRLGEKDARIAELEAQIGEGGEPLTDALIVKERLASKKRLDEAKASELAAEEKLLRAKAVELAMSHGVDATILADKDFKTEVEMENFVLRAALERKAESEVKPGAGVSLGRGTGAVTGVEGVTRAKMRDMQKTSEGQKWMKDHLTELIEAANRGQIKDE